MATERPHSKRSRYQHGCWFTLALKLLKMMPRGALKFQIAFSAFRPTSTHKSGIHRKLKFRIKFNMKINIEKDPSTFLGFYISTITYYKNSVT
jgi:hypothetical protein